MPSFEEVRKKWNLKQTLQSVRDTRNFSVDKTARFSGRFFQIALAVFAWYFLGSQDGAVIAKYGIVVVINWMWFFAIASPVVSAFLVVVYVTPWFSHSWTSRRILIVESSLDFLMALGWLAGFVAMLVAVNGACIPPAATPTTTPNCVNFNWLVSWLFLSFVAFSFGLGVDIWALYKGMCAKDDIEGEILLDIRRTARLNK